MTLIVEPDGYMNVFLDDVRVTPPNYIRVFNVEDTINLLKTRLVKNLSLDNDLGLDLLEGYHVLIWLEEAVFLDTTFPIPDIIIHSSNSARKQYMELAIKNINKIRQRQLEED